MGSLVGVRLVTSRELAEAILEKSGGNHRSIGVEAQSALLQQAARSLRKEGMLSFVGEVSESRGFLQVVARWLEEMHTQEISAAVFREHAERAGTPLERDLAHLYVRYEEMQQARGVRDESQIWAEARDALRRSDLFRGWRIWRVETQRRSPLESDWLAAWVGSGACVRLFVPWDDRRAASSAVLDSFREGYEALVGEGSLAQLFKREGVVASQRAENKHNLADMILDGPCLAEKGREGDLFPRVTLLEASSRESALRWVMRDIKQRLLDGEKASDIVVVSSSPEAYRKGAEAIAEEYGVPLSLPLRLGEQPLILFLQKLLRIAGSFPWLETMQVLRSPYLFGACGLSVEDIERLDRLTRERPVMGGRAQWEAALQKEQTAFGEDEEDEIFKDRKLLDKLTKEEVDDLRERLMTLFGWLMPPEKGTWQAYRLWVEKVFFGLTAISTRIRATEAVSHDEKVEHKGSLRLWHHLRDLEDGSQAMRWLQIARDQLYEMEAVDALLTRRTSHASEIEVEDIISWRVFRARFEEMLGGRSFQEGYRLGAVRVGPLEWLRERAWDRVYVLGMAEGAFPRAVEPDVLYAPLERAEHPLSVRKPLLRSEDGSLWWQCLQQTRKALLLTRPCFDEKGTALEPSPYWEDIVRCLPPSVVCHRSQEQVLLSPSQAASTGELLVAMAMQDAVEVPAALASRWQAVQHAYAVIDARLGEAEPGVFEGILKAPDILEDLATTYGESHRWSVSRLNRYGKCPYGFFANYLLRLEPYPDPEEGMDVKQWGILLHWILEKIFQWMSEQSIVPSPETEAGIMEKLEGLCGEAFSLAQVGLRFRPSFLWRYEQAEIRRILGRLLRHECQENAKEGYLPLFQELKFGMTGGALAAFSYESREGVRFQLNGIIDRVDRHPDGHLRIVDYKSGSTTFSLGDVAQGRSLQAALYALVVNALLGDYEAYRSRFAEPPEVMRSYYLHLPTRKKSGHLDRIDKRRSKKTEAVLAVAGERAASFVQKVRSGLFPNAPSAPSQGDGACSAHCDLASLCRVTRQSVAKAEKMRFFALAMPEADEVSDGE
jgi:ATP-dependent helicase/DNAse subunit B